MDADSTDPEGEENGVHWYDPKRELSSVLFWIYMVSSTVPVYVCVAVSKREQLVNNLQNLSVSDRIMMLKAMPLSVAEKSELR